MKFWGILLLVLNPKVSRSNESCSKVHEFNRTEGVVDAVGRFKNSIGYSGLQGAFQNKNFNSTKPCKAKIAYMYNKAGNLVLPSIESAQSAVRSKANILLLESMCPGFGMCADVVDSEDFDVWPITSLTYLVVSLFNPKKSCTRTIATQRYVSWILKEKEPKAIARSQQWAEMPDQVLLLASNIIESMSCISGNRTWIVSDLPASQADLTVWGSGSSLQQDLQPKLANAFYLQTAIDVHYMPSGSGQGLQDLISGDSDFAGSEVLLDSFMPAAKAMRLTMIPVFASAIAVIYSSNEVDRLILTRDLLNRIFLGQVDSWADPDLVEVNDQAGVGPYIGRKEAIIRIVRRDSSGTTQIFTKALYSFAGFPSPPIYSLHPLGGSALPSWPEAPWPSSSGANCIFCNCSDTAVAECGLGSMSWDGTCVSFETAIITILLPILFLGCIVASLAIWCARKRNVEEVQNFLLEEDLDYGNPVTILGTGSLGTVLKAEYRGSPVAVKMLDFALAGFSQPAVSTPHRSVQRRMSWWINSLSPGELDEASLDASSGVSGATSQICLQANTHCCNNSGCSTEALEASTALEQPNSNPPGCNSIRLSTTANHSGVRGSSPRRSSFATHDHVDLLLGSGDFEVPVKLNLLGCRTQRPSPGTEMRTATLLQDIRELARVRHPRVITVLGLIPGSANNPPKVVMEYMESGSLRDVLRNRGIILELEEQLSLLGDICKGMRYLHEASPPIVHGDIKSAEVLVDSYFRAKISGVGLCRFKEPTTLTNGIPQQHHAVGAPGFLAPELLRNETGPTKEADVYAYGIVIFEVFSRQDPYQGEDVFEVMQQVQNPLLIPDKRPPIPDTCPPLVQALMQECWHRDAAVRPAFSEVDRRLRGLEMMNKAKHPGQNCKNSNPNSLYLPPKFARAIEKGEQVEPEQKDMVTVYFSDIVGFTDISSTLSSSKVSELLDRLYTRLDALADTFGVYKLETIGDAYLAVTNLLDNMIQDHAASMAQFAVQAMKVSKSVLVDEDDPGRGAVCIRIGLASGPVTATILGTRNRKFTLLGDTMNTASRMESTSLPGRIQCTKTTAGFIRKQDACVAIEPRGEIEVKGKGRMKTFWVVSAGTNKTFAPRLRLRNASTTNSFSSTISSESQADSVLSTSAPKPPTDSEAAALLHLAPPGNQSLSEWSLVVPGMRRAASLNRVRSLASRMPMMAPPALSELEENPISHNEAASFPSALPSGGALAGTVSEQDGAVALEDLHPGDDAVEPAPFGHAGAIEAGREPAGLTMPETCSVFPSSMATLTTSARLSSAFLTAGGSSNSPFGLKFCRSGVSEADGSWFNDSSEVNDQPKVRTTMMLDEFTLQPPTSLLVQGEDVVGSLTEPVQAEHPQSAGNCSEMTRVEAGGLESWPDFVPPGLRNQLLFSPDFVNEMQLVHP